MRYFCTYFDSNYLLKGLTLYRSLVRHAGSFRLWILCFDDLSYKIIEKLELPEIIPISLKEFEKGDMELLQAKGNRSAIEYYFTSTPSLPLYIFKNYPEVELITYLDADLFFFSDLSPIFDEFGNNSILIIGHRFPLHLRHLEVNGVYNVGYLSFRRDKEGLACLEWWRKKCIEWCYDRVEKGRFADQKYLDDWPVSFANVKVLEHKGANLAPWNLNNYIVSVEFQELFIDNQPLIFFHFHGLKKVGRYLYDSGLRTYNTALSPIFKHYLYSPYIKELHKTQGLLTQLADRPVTGAVTTRHTSKIFRLNAYKISLLCDVLRGRFLFVDGTCLV